MPSERVGDVPDPATRRAEARAELYRRLPLLEHDRWWMELARTSSDGHVLELGAGTGRLTAGFVAAGCQVTAVEQDATMLRVLRDQVGRDATVVAGDVTDLPPLPAAGLVVLASSLLNELGDPSARRRALAGAAAVCRPDGRVALHLLSPWWLVRFPRRATGRLEAADGVGRVEVTVTDDGFDPHRGRRRATLTYDFADGTRLRDHLDAAVVTPGELALALDDAGLEVVADHGVASSDDGPTFEASAWSVVCRPRG